MPRYLTRTWKGNPTGQTRKDREPFKYQAYVPDQIADADLPLPGPLAAATSEAERALAELNHDPPALKSLEALARQLLRAESVASSRIEGLELSHKRLARAAYDEKEARDETASSVLGNIRAMERAIEMGADPAPVTVESMLDLHRTLMGATRDARFGGVVRDKQNWIGGETFSPRGAEFVPPPPEYIPKLLEDLAAFLNREDLPATQQAAVAHAQFETIHPFADGNGRVGRCLIHVVLRRRALAERYVPPISLILAANADQYVKGLTAYRAERVDEWCFLFAQTVIAAAREARSFADRVAELQEEWRQRADSPRRGSAASRIIDQLPAHSLIDTKTAEQVIGASDEAVRLALQRLEQAGVLTRVNTGDRNRVWEAAELYDALNEFERSLADL
jgi:Fic family protein